MGGYGPREASVEVFHSEISARADEHLGRLIEFLSPEERSRAARLVFPEDRRLFVAAHALVRWCLKRATGAERLEFEADGYGKPALNPPLGDPFWSFNLTHTNGLAACVLARGYAAGIDAEEMVARGGLETIARRAFTEEEQRMIAASAGPKRTEIFYRLWTVKEALVKGIGRGLRVNLRDIALTLEPLGLSLAARSGEDAACWQVREIALEGKHRIAVAVKVPADMVLVVRSQAIEIGDLAAT